MEVGESDGRIDTRARLETGDTLRAVETTVAREETRDHAHDRGVREDREADELDGHHRERHRRVRRCREHRMN
jgi:hypothetical protein